MNRLLRLVMPCTLFLLTAVACFADKIESDHSAAKHSIQASQNTAEGNTGVSLSRQSLETGAVLLASARAHTGYGCCKICRVGKACGNSCISRRYHCHQPPGCACDDD